MWVCAVLTNGMAVVYVNCLLHGRYCSPAIALQEEVAPVYAAVQGNRVVVNNTFKRQRQLSGANTGGD